MHAHVSKRALTNNGLIMNFYYFEYFTNKNGKTYYPLKYNYPHQFYGGVACDKLCPNQHSVYTPETRNIEAGFNGGTITSDGGVQLLRQVDRRLGLSEAVNEVIPNPCYIQHTQLSLLRQRVYDRLAAWMKGSEVEAEIRGVPLA